MQSKVSLSDKDSQSISIRFPKNWIVQLKRLAREQSVTRDGDVAYADLIREAVQKAYIKEN